MSAPATASMTVTGRLIESGETRIVLGVPDTDYKLQLEVTRKLDQPVGQRVTGTIRARARRVDKVGTGGRFVEPVFGRPRRVQGRVIGGEAASNTLIVQAGPGITLHCVLTDTRQQVANFNLHDLVGFDVEPGSVFEPEA